MENRNRTTNSSLICMNLQMLKEEYGIDDEKWCRTLGKKLVKNISSNNCIMFTPSLGEKLANIFGMNIDEHFMDVLAEKRCDEEYLNFIYQKTGNRFDNLKSYLQINDLFDGYSSLVIAVKY